MLEELGVIYQFLKNFPSEKEESIYISIKGLKELGCCYINVITLGQKTCLLCEFYFWDIASEVICELFFRNETLKILTNGNEETYQIN